MKILLVDDDVYLRDIYTIKFTKSGHTVDVAETGSLALLKLKQNDNYDVILLDMIMTDMTGVELMKKIKKEFLGLKAKFIMLSNQGQIEDIAEAKSAGSSGYIIKAQTVPSEVVERVEFLNKK